MLYEPYNADPGRLTWQEAPAPIPLTSRALIQGKALPLNRAQYLFLLGRQGTENTSNLYGLCQVLEMFPAEWL